jgi:hypothetical protein
MPPLQGEASPIPAAPAGVPLVEVHPAGDGGGQAVIEEEEGDPTIVKDAVAESTAEADEPDEEDNW